MPRGPSRFRLRLALDPFHWRNEDKANWAAMLVDAVAAAAPHLTKVESYSIGDTLVYIHLRSLADIERTKRLIRRDEGLVRLGARLADLGARAEFEFDED